MNNSYLMPKEIVEHLDKYIVGQNEAKKSVAIALRNRWRRQNAPEDIRNEIKGLGLNMKLDRRDPAV